MGRGKEANGRGNLACLSVLLKDGVNVGTGRALAFRARYMDDVEFRQVILLRTVRVRAGRWEDDLRYTRSGREPSAAGC